MTLPIKDYKREARDVHSAMMEILNDAEKFASEEGRARYNALKSQYKEYLELADAGFDPTEKSVEADHRHKQQRQQRGFKSNAEYLHAVWRANHVRNGAAPDPRLKRFSGDPGERFMDVTRFDSGDGSVGAEWATKADGDMLTEPGAVGGYLAPDERAEGLFFLPPEPDRISPRCTTIPMRRRVYRIPKLDQTSSTSGQFNEYGGVQAFWTEEAAEMTQSQPSFGQISLEAFKLATYARVSDELLEDGAMAFDSWLSSDVGFRGAIQAERERTFLRGTGVGQPKGVLQAGGRYTVARNTANRVLYEDIVAMEARTFERTGNAVWVASRSVLPQLMRLEDSEGNLIWQDNARATSPNTLFGRPIVYSDVMPLLGTEGDLMLVNFAYYYVGERAATTIDSSNHELFKYGLTSWRAMHRVGGIPAMDAPYTAYNGWQTSPYVVLTDAAS